MCERVHKVGNTTSWCNLCGILTKHFHAVRGYVIMTIRVFNVAFLDYFSESKKISASQSTDA